MDKIEAQYQKQISTSYVKRIHAWLDELKENLDILTNSEILPADYKAIGNTHDMLIRDTLLGIDSAVAGAGRGMKAFSDTIPIETLPFEEAVAFLKTQVPLSKDAYYALDDKIRFRAFTVGRLNDGDAINKVKGIITRGLNEGATLSDYYTWTDDEILNNIGFGKGDMAYWETVYRTNEQSVHNAGRAMGFQEVQPIAIELVGVNDLRQSETCRALTSPPFIRPYNDPIWKTLWPPFHFSCRTFPHGIYDSRELDEYGGPERAYRQGNYAAPEKGFGAYPLDKESWWRMTPDMWERAKEYGITGEIILAAQKLDMMNYAEELSGGVKETRVFPGGGYVKTASKAAPSEIEKDIAQRAAEGGHELFFLPESTIDGLKNPDILIDNEIGDIKRISTPTRNAVDNALKRAREQNVHTALLRVPDEMAKDEIIKTARNRMGTKIKRVIVEWRGGIFEI